MRIDAHISTRYALPLPHTPPILRRLACAMALYYLSSDAASPHGGEGQPLRSRRGRRSSSSPGARPSVGLPEAQVPKTLGSARRWMRAARHFPPAGEGCEEVRSLKFEVFEIFGETMKAELEFRRGKCDRDHGGGCARCGRDVLEGGSHEAQLALFSLGGHPGGGGRAP